MSFFSRNKDAVEPVRTDDVPFDSLRRSPRGSRKPRATEPEVDAAAPLDPAQAVKTRARRRLIGAAALALAAVVFVPMLFDRSQTSPPDDIAVQIPDRDSPFEGRRGVPDTSKGPLRPSGPLSPAAPEPSAAATNTVPPPVTPADTSKPAAVEKPVDKGPDKPAEKGPDKSADKAAEKPAQKIAEKPAEKAAERASEKAKSSAAPAPAQGDDPRALAALEGKAVPPASSEGATGKGYAVQIAAFSVADKAKGLRDQLNSNGMKAYIEPLSTPQGARTRVRLGPFPSREAAERARQKLRTMKLDGSVVPL